VLCDHIKQPGDTMDKAKVRSLLIHVAIVAVAGALADVLVKQARVPATEGRRLVTTATGLVLAAGIRRVLRIPAADQQPA
jgi:hypothetical protein